MRSWRRPFGTIGTRWDRAAGRAIVVENRKSQDRQGHDVPVLARGVWWVLAVLVGRRTRVQSYLICCARCGQGGPGTTRMHDSRLQKSLVDTTTHGRISPVSSLSPNPYCILFSVGESATCGRGKRKRKRKRREERGLDHQVQLTRSGRMGRHCTHEQAGNTLSSANTTEHPMPSPVAFSCFSLSTPMTAGVVFVFTLFVSGVPRLFGCVACKGILYFYTCAVSWHGLGAGQFNPGFVGSPLRTSLPRQENKQGKSHSAASTAGTVEAYKNSAYLFVGLNRKIAYRKDGNKQSSIRKDNKRERGELVEPLNLSLWRRPYLLRAFVLYFCFCNTVGLSVCPSLQNSPTRNRV